jgi:peptidyl-prolyl cis-trans isomerase A (cyclophilin A)
MKIHILVVLLTFLSCQKQAEDKPNKSNRQPTSKSEKPKPTAENLEDFLYDYGDQNQENQVVIETNFGQITIELFNDTFLHRANFIYLVKQGYYDGMEFHRIINHFMVQGGKNKTYETTKRRTAIGYHELPAEIIKGLKHERGMLSAAREWENNPAKKSSPFEFFIVQKNAPHLNGEHTVFGQVTAGMEVVDAISKVPTGENNWPREPVIIKKMTLK